MPQNINETWIKNSDGTMQLVATEIIEITEPIGPTTEELIAQAELELAQKYQELLELRSNKNQ